MSTPGMVISRFTPSSSNAERARSRSITWRSSPNRSNSRRCRSIARRSSSGTICSPNHDRPLAPRHLPAQRLCWLVRNPDFWQEAAGIELRQNAGIDRVRLDLGIGDDAHLLRVCDHDFLHVQRDNRGGRGRVAGSLDHHNVARRQLCGKRLQQVAPHVDTAQLPEPAVLPCHASAKARWISSPMMHMPVASFLARSKNGNWRATRHLLIRARSASGKVAGGGHVTSSGSQPTV